MYAEDEHENLSGIGMPGATSSQIELNEDHPIPQTSSDYLDDMDEEEGEGEKPFSYFDFLDRPRILPEPCDLTLEHLKQISYELGLIKLCWPEILHPTFEDRTNFPESYLKNSDKEKLLLLYTENFRQQFCHRHPHRKPLFLACENECGMQKMVCTTIRPTTLAYSELQSWEDLTKFVGDHLKYEPLEEPTLIPRRLCSPHTTFLRQGGHSFEISTALCSLLLGLSYDAYVVSGYATKDVTLRILSRVDTPYPPIEEEEEVKEEPVVHEKYKLRPPKDLRSQFLLMMAQREVDKKKAEQEKVEEMERLWTLQEERPPYDELEGQRVHSWILLKAGAKGVEEDVFLEPSNGLVHPLGSFLYCGIESIWNDVNYWVNMQDCSQGLGHLKYDLTNIEHWEHLLIGEPVDWRKSKPKDLGEEDEANNEMFDEKHLDLPFSWSMRISIPHDGTLGAAPKDDQLPQGKGSFYSFKNGKVTKYLTKIGISNGIAIDTNLNKFYYIDSFKGTIDQYDFDVEKGTITNETPVYTLFKKYEPENKLEVLDGMTIDSDGNLWAAVFNQSRVIKVNPRNPDTIEDFVQIPGKQVTSVAFGGPNFDELYVTTGRLTVKGETPSSPQDGGLYRVTGLNVKGLPAERIVL